MVADSVAAGVDRAADAAADEVDPGRETAAWDQAACVRQCA